MKIKYVSLRLLALILLCVFVMPIQAQSNVHNIGYDNILFSYPSTLATGIQIETIEAVPLSRPDEQFWVATYPEHIRFGFVNYLDGSQFQLPLLQHIYPHQAQILVYTSDAIREFGYEFAEQLDALNTVLNERPELSNLENQQKSLAPDLYLPFLPWINATQVLCSHPQYIEAPGSGSGIRYVTYYSQGMEPITDRQIFYTFQGIMDGGAYYVSAIFPVKTGVLPDEVNANDIDWDQFGATYADHYLVDTLAQIDSVPDEAFYPNLNTLDTLIESITFEREGVNWGTYTHVAAAYRFQYPPDRQICVFENRIEIIDGARYYDDPEGDACAVFYQANPISVIFEDNDKAFQAFRAENYPDSFTNYREEVVTIENRLAVRVSGKEIATGQVYSLVRIEHQNMYLILRAMGDDNIAMLDQILATVRFT